MSMFQSKSFCLGFVVLAGAILLPAAVQAQSSRAQEMMQKHQDRVDEMRQKSSDKFDEMRRKSDERMAEARQRHQEVFDELENRNTSSSSTGSSSSSGFRLRGRSIRGLIFIVLAVGAGVMKLFGFASGNRGE